ncbi:MAG: UDP-N-acetylmuramate--L-alanine ligase, partial [Candidatus Omnitrophica bacterium]|nr:UDP-N-acetylmuramate--L-alanine ligase [Candidatus Omnitrophota bacterium]
LLTKGYQVSGSDLRDNDVTQALTRLGAEIFRGHQANQVNKADIVVISSAIKEDNPEYQQAVKLKKNIIKRAMLLVELMKDYISLTVAGAHGKTTTTSMIAHIFTKTNLNPTIAVGGVMHGLGTNANLGDGKYFIAEVDESDGSFLNFNPNYSVITNVDLEHVDHYHNWFNLLNAYKDFIERTHNEGMIIAYGEDRRLVNLIKDSTKNFITYGFHDYCDLVAKNISVNENKTRFECYFKDQLLGQMELSVLGKHNIANALGATAAGIQVGLSFQEIKSAIATYSGVARRMQYKGNYRNITFYDDYAHHPTEIASTLKSARFIKSKTGDQRPFDRLVAVFQPHRYTRFKYFWNDFMKCLSLADRIIVTDVYEASEKAIEDINSVNFVNEFIESYHLSIDYCARRDLKNFLCQVLKPNDLVLTLGAGDITKVGPEVLNQLEYFESKISTVT